MAYDDILNNLKREVQIAQTLNSDRFGLNLIVGAYEADNSIKQ